MRLRAARVRGAGRSVCGDDCPLTSCEAGRCATVLVVTCTAADAHRLRTLGVYEGALVSVVDRRSGVLLDVCGTRLALNDAVAASILVRPAAA
jgi:Fe2+ transport system protein FeoA